MSTFKRRKPTGGCPRLSRMYVDGCPLNVPSLQIDILSYFQGSRVHASGKWSSATGAPPKMVHLGDIKSRLAPIDSHGTYFLCCPVRLFSCVDLTLIQTCTHHYPSRDLVRSSRG